MSGSTNGHSPAPPPTTASGAIMGRKLNPLRELPLNDSASPPRPVGGDSIEQANATMDHIIFATGIISFACFLGLVRFRINNPVDANDMKVNEFLQVLFSSLTFYMSVGLCLFCLFKRVHHRARQIVIVLFIAVVAVPYMVLMGALVHVMVPRFSIGGLDNIYILLLAHVVCFVVCVVILVVF